ncbi:hypothetical protein [Actinomadura rupiterrae]|uniref:hypothetical protein n=1 Tax=Actinomadura rupiterrae TaxID=559627 RepID=UPI0020A27D67|nr:hypothetical protein [Actinomadura rupiterrae]MCP2337562.1 hypothetical protein [Actinomadura rupiterrae]
MPESAARAGVWAQQIPAGNGLADAVAVAATARPSLQPSTPGGPERFEHPTPALAALQTAPRTPLGAFPSSPAASAPAAGVGGVLGQAQPRPAEATGLNSGSVILHRIGELLRPFRARAAWPGTLPDDPALEQLAVCELSRLRAAHPGWGIVYQPFARAWIALCEGGHVVVVGTPQELDAALRSVPPSPTCMARPSRNHRPGHPDIPP